ncbi:MAG: DUF4180 domain-containing protein [Spirochaetota bacterium]
MNFKLHELGEMSIAELDGDSLQVGTPHDALYVIGNAGARIVILHVSQIHPDFFRLGTGLAGEILQKFANYRVRCAIIGDFSSYRSPALQAFIRESNRTGQIVFVPDLEAAIKAFKEG